MGDNANIDYTALRAAFMTADNKVSEAKIAQHAIKEWNIISRHGVPYNCDGEVDRADIISSVADLLIALGVERGNARLAEQIVKLMIQLSTSDELKLERNVIPVANGTITVKMSDGSFVFSPRKTFTPYRLCCDFDPNDREMPWFNRWKIDVLYPEDHDCFQEFMGYLLLPITYAQAAAFLLGEGGTGKSVWGCVLRAIFGKAMTAAETHALENDRFARATLENKLLNYDDDLDGAKMQKTNLFKILVTAKQPIQAERKGVDRFEFLPFARLCGCGNSALASMFDLTDAFVRRLLLIKTKPPIPRDKIIPDIEQRIIPESSAILNWALEGLTRLIQNNYQFSVSQRSKELIQTVREESNSILPFIDDELEFGDGFYISSQTLVNHYKRYCREMDLVARDSKLVPGYFKDHAEQFGIRYVNKVPVTRNRGFIGMKLKSDNTQSKPSIDLNGILK